MSEMKKRNNLKGHSLLILKEKFIAITKEHSVQVYDLDTMKRLYKSNYIEYPSGFCTNPDESMLYCFTTTNKIYVFDTNSWECKEVHTIIPPCTVDENKDFFELRQIFYIEENWLLANEYNNLYLIDLHTDKVELIWDSGYIESRQIIYTKQENTASYFYVNYDDQGLREKGVKRKPPRLMNSKSHITISLKEIMLAPEVLLYDEKENIIVSLEHKWAIFRKTKSYVVFQDLRTQEEIKCELPSGLLKIEPKKGCFVKELGLIILLYRRKLVILQKKDHAIEIKKIIYMKYAEDYFIAKNKLVLIGWEYGIVVNLQNLSDEKEMENKCK